jgi:hypothetical protein
MEISILEPQDSKYLSKNTVNLLEKLHKLLT